MYNIELLNLLETVLNKGYQLKNGEVVFYCPFCHHHRKKLQINLENQKWHCWTCNKGGYKLFQLLRKINTSKNIISDILKLVDEVRFTGETKTDDKEIGLPKEYKPLWDKSKSPVYKHAIRYLKKRNVDVRDILRYSIGYCESGVYENRIIIPSYDENGILNYFLARDIFPESRMKYKNPPFSKDIIPFDLFVNWNKDIILCEGVMDAIAIRKNVIPLLGKFLPNKLKKKLIEKKVEKVYIALDEDAKQDAVKLAKFLMDSGIKIYLIEMKGKDPSEIGFSEFWKLVDDTKETRFSDLIRGQLYG